MKKIFNFGIIMALAAGTSLGQKPPAPTAVGFVNAVGVASKTDFQIDGKNVKPAGFLEGAYSSSVGLTEGTHQLTFVNSSCEKTTQNVVAKEGLSPLYVLYKVAIPQPNGATKNVLKLTTIPGQPQARGIRFFAFSTLENRPAVLRANGSELRIEPLKLTVLEGSKLRVEDEGVKSKSYEPSESGTYILVLFDGSNSRMRSVLVEMAK